MVDQDGLISVISVKREGEKEREKNRSTNDRIRNGKRTMGCFFLNLKQKPSMITSLQCGSIDGLLVLDEIDE